MNNEYTVIGISKIDLRPYLQKQNYPEDLIYPILNGYKSDKYNWEGVLHTNNITLLRLRFGQNPQSGIDLWRIIDEKHMKGILDAVYYDKSLCEWIKIV